ncbi:TetR/AcrR family transcriptional regulator [Membranicola marinus]|uniref:TetR/AcrR family transcriptional regulator n=1 Tax=Membranihabitans marinus TaxID=1227546 RepID=A0A953LAQ5_9BACT|nr:TetR/AcrR family transcriptional regulator [Membranihabitans marinus]MBY5960210.1 TetR/AcrR family transcriptional regulator [Membranihabitans marinus]
MALTKREEKEIEILNSAEKTFSEHGYDNTKMEDIASQIGISKGLVYFYYSSKENLYMALTYRAMHKMNDAFYEVYHDQQNKSGLDSVITLVRAYMDFLDENPFYLELLLNYTRLVRSSTQKTNQLTDSMKNSIYFRKIKDIHNIPITIFQEEINRGQKDGSIKNTRSPNLMYMTMWSLIVGFSQIKSAAAQNNRMTMYHINLNEWRDYIIEIAYQTMIDDAH